jgi:hypothetical protein
MAQSDITYEQYDAGGAGLTGETNREDLADVIYNISPTETPFLSMAGRGTAAQSKHEWLIDELVDAAANYQFEADNYDGEARTPASRVYTYTQISAKALIVSGTQEVVKKAGRTSELAYLLAMQSKEIKRDMERQLVGFMTTGESAAIDLTNTDVGDSYPNAIGTADAATARVTANLATWLRANTDESGTAASSASAQPPDAGNANCARLAGTPRAFLESQLKSVMRSAWTAGGNPNTLIVDAYNKQVISAFTGGATRFDRSEDRRLVTAIDVYESDFGSYRVIPDRFLVNPDATAGSACYVLDMNYWSIDYLRPFQQTPLAKTGDAEKRLLLAEWCLKSANEAASGGVFDLTVS